MSISQHLSLCCLLCSVASLLYPNKISWICNGALALGDASHEEKPFAPSVNTKSSNDKVRVLDLVNMHVLRLPEGMSYSNLSSTFPNPGMHPLISQCSWNSTRSRPSALNIRLIFVVATLLWWRFIWITFLKVSCNYQKYSFQALSSRTFKLPMLIHNARTSFKTAVWKIASVDHQYLRGPYSWSRPDMTFSQSLT